MPAPVLSLELAQALVAHAEQLEAVLEAARSAAQLTSDKVTGLVRITSTERSCTA